MAGEAIIGKNGANMEIEVYFIGEGFGVLVFRGTGEEAK